MDPIRELYLLKQEYAQLKQNQISFQLEMERLQRSIHNLEQQLQLQQTPSPGPTSSIPDKNRVETNGVKPAAYPKASKDFYQTTKENATQSRSYLPTVKQKPAFNLEQFIGTNLINKIGILILIIGIIIGSKYAIDRNLISPTLRIIIGYIIGGGLLAVAIKLKQKHEAFSAVLLSGAMTSLYFLTYAAYNYYHIFGTVVAFLLMLIFTIFTVLAALRYNKEIIALLGMVGAYGIPLLVGKDTGSPIVLMTYIFIINCGIYYIFLLKNWKITIILAGLATWLIFIIWQATHSLFEKNQYLLLFALLFYYQQYFVQMWKHHKQNIAFSKSATTLLLAHTTIFIIVGLILSFNLWSTDLRWLFLLINGTIYFVTAYLAKQTFAFNKNLLNSLGVICLALIAPTTFKGYFITTYWLLQSAALILWSKKDQNIIIYYLSILLLALASISLVMDFEQYNNMYYYHPNYLPVLNKIGLTSLLASVIYLLHAKYGYDLNLSDGNNKPLKEIIWGSIGIALLFLTGSLELYHYFDFHIYSYLTKQPNNIVQQMSSIYVNNTVVAIYFIYAFTFLIILQAILLKLYPNKVAGTILTIFLTVATFAFLLVGLYAHSELRDLSTVEELKQTILNNKHWMIYRYTALILLAGNLFGLYYWSPQNIQEVKKLKYSLS